MRKFISICLILILLGLFSSTFYCSRQTEAAFRAQVENLQQTYAGSLQVKLEDYRSGLFLSRARVSLLFSSGGSLILKHQIRHFPWGVEMVTDLAEGSELAAELSKVIPLEQLQLLTKVDLRGRSHSTLELPELSFSESSGEFKLSGLKLVCDLDRTLRDGELSFALARLAIIEGGQAGIELNGVGLQSRFADQQGLPLGDGELRIDRLVFHRGDQPGMEIKDFHYLSQTQLTGEKVGGQTDLSFAELDMLGERFTQARLKLDLQGIDIAAIHELQDSAKQMQADLLSRKVDPLVLQVQMLGLYAQLLQNGLDLKLEQLELQGDGGSLQGGGSLHLPEHTFSGAPGINLEQLKADFYLDVDHRIFASGVRLLDKLQHQGQASANPAVLNEQAEQLAGALLQKGVFSRRAEGGYRIELAFDQGQGRLNGRPFKP